MNLGGWKTFPGKIPGPLKLTKAIVIGMSMIHVVAVITANSGMRAQILEAFKANTVAVHAEEGCIEYGAVIDAEGVGPFQTKFGEDTFAVIEKWESLDHLMSHAASEHMKAYAAKTKPLIASRTIHVLNTA